ncbi:MAG: hypothetical protein AAGH15_11100 [Myxococcota bacterium]
MRCFAFLLAVLGWFGCTSGTSVPDGDAGDRFDAGRDTGVDLATDAGVDEGPCGSGLGTCFDVGFGLPCASDDDCCVGVCQPELPAPEPTADAPAPRVTPLFPGGFCTIDPVTTRAEPDCLSNPGICGDCLTCLEVLPGQGGCFVNCDPAAPGNDICVDGWQCAPLRNGGGACVEGCSVDADCLVRTVVCVETNGVPGCQSSEDCAATPDDCDGLGADLRRISPQASARCDPETFACQLFGDPTAQAGDRCFGDAECETGGRCEVERVLTFEGDELVLFPGGHCVGPPCRGGRECNGDGACGGGRSAFWTELEGTCLAGCNLTVGVDAGDPSTWLTGRGGCDEGYFCLSNADGANPEVGVCFPDRVDPFSVSGAFLEAFGSGPTEANIGAPCTQNDECFNPFGFGRCLVGFNGRDGYCTVDEAEVLEAVGFDVCGDGAADGSLPVGVTAPPTSENKCLTTCEDGNDCPSGFGCIRTGDADVCFPTGCTASTDCRVGEECLLGACFDTCATADACDDGLGCVPLREVFAVDGDQTVCFDACRRDDQCPRAQVCVGATAEDLGQCDAP